MSDLAIRIENLSKSYTIAHNAGARATNLREAMIQRLRKPFARSESETFWALKDIDLEIERGEVVGVLGRNGAGKSTLLKILSRITEPTKGRIELYGRVGSLLEVGTGFHPELTGIENIFLNGAILGMRKSEINQQFDAIVDFAGVEKFLDTPVKRYSSGMYVRLAFAVAAHLNPEILIVDEVLAVGDAEFQKKCMGKMKEVSSTGRTVLFVSHNLNAIETLCTKSFALIGGSISGYKPTEEMLAEYCKIGQTASRGNLLLEGPLAGVFKCMDVCINGISVRSQAIRVTTEKPIAVSHRFQITEPLLLRMTIAIFYGGVRIFTEFDHDAFLPYEPGMYEVTYQIDADLLNSGRYTLGLGASSDCAQGDWAWNDNLATFEVASPSIHPSDAYRQGILKMRNKIVSTTQLIKT